MEKINENEEEIRCRYCESDNIRVSNKGISLGGATLGILTFGIVGGLIGGLAKSKELEFTCLACAYKWYPFDPYYTEVYKQGDARKEEEKRKLQEQEKQIISPERQKQIDRAIEINKQTKMKSESNKTQEKPTIRRRLW